jgi:hypothetical protein
MLPLGATRVTRVRSHPGRRPMDSEWMPSPWVVAALVLLAGVILVLALMTIRRP